jgi:hypothetical protein
MTNEQVSQGVVVDMDWKICGILVDGLKVVVRIRRVLGEAPISRWIQDSLFAYGSLGSGQRRKGDL